MKRHVARFFSTTLHRRSRAFSLVELLVVIAIIGVLIGLLMPAVQQVREAARRTDCANRIRQLGIALHHYHDVKKKFPRGISNYSYTSRSGSSNAYGAILPYIEQNNLKEDYDHMPNHGSVGSVPISTFQCPTSASIVDQDGGMPGAAADYAFCKGRSAAFCDKNIDRGIFGIGGGTRRMELIRDGTSHTMMMGEAASDPGIPAEST